MDGVDWIGLGLMGKVGKVDVRCAVLFSWKEGR